MTNTLIAGFLDPTRPAQSLTLRNNAIVAERLNLNSVQLELGAHPGSVFNECNLAQSNLAWSFLDESKFLKTVLIAVNFKNSGLRACLYKECVLYETCYDNADLEGARFLEGEAHTCSFKGANLKSVVFNLKSWSKLDVSGARYNKDTVWPCGFDPVAQGAILET